MRRFGLTILTLALPAILSPAVGTPSRAGSIVVSPAQEAAWGEGALADFLSSRELDVDGALLVRADRLVRELSSVSERPSLPYRIVVVRGDELQAISFPGGTICVTGTLVRLLDSDDELAFAIAHEMAHVALRHHVNQLRMQELLRVGARGDRAVLEVAKARFDQDAELEADRFGALYVVRAGRRFSASTDALERISEAVGEIQEDEKHPEFADRVSALRAFETELQRSIQAFQQGVAALERRNADEALAAFGLFVSQFPNSPAGRVNLGTAHLLRVRKSTGTPEGLAEPLPIVSEPGIVLRGPLPEVELEHARIHFARALEIDPDDLQARAGLAAVLARLGRFDEARELLRLAAERDPMNAKLVLCLGNVDYLSHRYSEAQSSYLRALTLLPAWSAAKKNLALASERLGDSDRAREMWQELMDDRDHGFEARQHLAALDTR